MVTYFGSIDTPLGDVLLLGEGDALTGLYFDRGPEAVNSEWEPDEGRLDTARAQITEYFEGSRKEFDLAIRPTGTPFQMTVWKALLDVGYGCTDTYGGIAAKIGRPTAVRAVGGANGRNPISLIVPCHRVIGAGGALTGYGWATAGGSTARAGC
jgi:methylated-DNA-[protein]-cysteine S-methyltransferase